MNYFDYLTSLFLGGFIVVYCIIKKAYELFSFENDAKIFMLAILIFIVISSWKNVVDKLYRDEIRKHKRRKFVR